MNRANDRGATHAFWVTPIMFSLTLLTTSPAAGVAEYLELEDYLTESGAIDLQAMRAGGIEGEFDLSPYTMSLDPETGTPSFSPGSSVGWVSEFREAALFAKINGEHIADMVNFQGNLVVAGDFNLGTLAIVRSVAAWNGSNWTTVGTNLPEQDTCYSLAVHGSDLHVGGEFGIRRWNGTSWVEMGTGLTGDVYSLHSHNGLLIAGGDFSINGSGVALNAASWNGTTWTAIATKGNGVVSALGTYGGDLVAAGDFSTIAGVAANSIARWNGAAWLPLGSGLTDASGSGVYRGNTLAVYQGNLVVGGRFDRAGGTSVHNMAQWDGTSWSTLYPGLGQPEEEVLTLSPYTALGYTYLVAGGTFTQLAGYPSEPGFKRIARWNGSQWSTFENGVDDSQVRSLEQFGSSLAIGGSFQSASQRASSGLITVDLSQGSIDWRQIGAGVHGLPQSAGSVRAAAYYLGDLYVAGEFKYAGGFASSIARWDGTSWQTVPGGPYVAGDPNPPLIHALGVFENLLLVGGDFNKIGGGVDCPYLAAWDGVAWSNPIVSDRSLDGQVRAITDGYIGGDFTSPKYVAKLVFDPVSSLYGPGWVGVGFNGRVRALGMLGSTLYAGGDFTASITGDPMQHISRWDGTAWQACGAGVDGPVYALAATGPNETELSVGGSFSLAGNLSTSNVARWTGTAWNTYGAGLDGTVRSLASFGGFVIAGGDFLGPAGNDISIIKPRRIGRWNGTSWAPLQNTGSAGINNSVHMLLTQAGFMWVGGSFSRTNGLLNFSLARYYGSSLAPKSTDPSTSRVSRETIPSLDHLSVPFRPGSDIRYSLGASEWCELGVFDLAGRQVAELHRGFLGAGAHAVEWSGHSSRGSRLASGLYFVRLRTSRSAVSQKLILLND